jgi:glycosyltransferase involved in cell wall biosynthesis
MNSIRKPLVSVIVPVYNDERFIEECARSVLEQTFGDLELILVDDASTDGTGRILEELSNLDKRVRVIWNRIRQGIAASRNKAFSVSEGEYIGILDSDDSALPERIEKQVDFLEKNARYAGCGSRVEFMDEDSRVILINDTTVKEGEVEDLRRDPSSLVHPSCTLRRDVFEKTGGYRTEFERGVDYDFFLRVLERFRLANMREVLTRQRFHLERGTVKERRKQLACCELADRLADQRAREGADMLQRGRVEDFNLLKKELLGQGRDNAREVSYNYVYWAHRMYHRGPLNLARKMVIEAIKYYPLNVRAWVYALFLYSGKNVRDFLTVLKRCFRR